MPLYKCCAEYSSYSSRKTNRLLLIEYRIRQNMSYKFHNLVLYYTVTDKNVRVYYLIIYLLMRLILPNNVHTDSG